MAPSPEHDNEPKAPDKSDNNNKKTTTTTTKLQTDLIDDTSSQELQESSVSTLDDGQLKALLDEAINYKCPKDREGKSKIFKVLLQEAEEDERNARAASASGPQLARYYNTSAQRHKHRGTGGRSHGSQSVAEGLTHGGSLQNLAQSEFCDPSLYLGSGGSHCRRRGQMMGGKKGTSVSARQREGGSLPSNVNSTGSGRQFVNVFEQQEKRSSAEERQARVSTSSEPEKVTSNSSRYGHVDYVIDLSGHVDPDETKNLLDHDVLNHNFESSSVTYSQHDSCVSQQDDQPLPSFNKIRYTSPKTNIDTGIMFPQLISTSSSFESSTVIAPVQLEGNYNCVKSLVNDCTVETKHDPLSTFRSTSASANHTSVVGRQPSQAMDILGNNKKALDENSNSVQSMDNNGKTKKKKPRADKKETVFQSEHVEGHRADIIEDIDLLVKYVESSDAEGTTTGAKRNTKHQHQHQRRSTSGRTLSHKSSKSSDTGGVKKSNSLDEISTSKLEDLVTSSKGDRRSWGTEDGEQYYCKKLQQQEQIAVDTFHSSPIEPAMEMSEFQVVNSKKKKSRKRRPGETSVNNNQNTHDGGVVVDCDAPVVNSSNNTQRNRRKSSCSMPVSDKSDSSDLDSVHSLPVSAKLGNVAVSYADMASVATQSSPPIISEAPPKKLLSPTPFLNSVEHFPELCRVTPSNNTITNNLFNTPITTATSNQQENATSASAVTNNNNTNNSSNVNVSANVHVDRRPPVIIPVSKETIDVSGLTFGFEVNEQLLALGNETQNTQECDGVTTLNMADSFTARYLAPVVLNNYNHDKIVSYVGQEWEKIVHQAGGKVRYYSDQ